MKYTVILLIAILIGTNPGYAQKLTSKERKEQKAEQIKTLMDNQDFKFVALSVTPLSGPRINITNNTYFLSVDNGNVKSELPYFGRAYVAEYGKADVGMKFEAQAKDTSVEFNGKKNMYNVFMAVSEPNETYQIYISAGLNGYATVNITSNNRQTVSYYGTIEPVNNSDDI